MRERLGLVAEQEADVARDGLLLQELEAKPGVVDGGRVLPPLEGVARPAPPIAPLRSEIASFAFVVDAKDEQAAAFYARYRFLPLTAGGRRMFVPMAEVAKLFARLSRP